VALVACPECQSQVSDQAESCPRCGYPLKRQRDAAKASPPPAEPKVFLADNPNYNSTGSSGVRYNTHMAQQGVKVAKSRGVYIILALFFGLLGVHNFYAGFLGRGLTQLLIVLILGWVVIGFVIVFIWVVIECFTVTQDAAGDKMV